jgi:hypothetical protein
MSPSEELRAARTAQLAAAAARRAESARADVQRALMRLRAKGGPFDLSAVATEAGCSTSYLRKHPDLLSEIRAAGSSSAARPARRGSASSSSLDSLRTKLLLVTERLRALEGENARLREENAVLRGELLDQRRKSRR